MTAIPTLSPITIKFIPIVWSLIGDFPGCSGLGGSESRNSECVNVHGRIQQNAARKDKGGLADHSDENEHGAVRREKQMTAEEEKTKSCCNEDIEPATCK